MQAINNVPWTKLNKDGIWNHAAMKYMNPVGRSYHNMQHIVDIYNYAHKLRIPYDIDLDVAILFHDIIYDEKDNKEIRSAYDFMEIVRNVIGKTLMIVPDKVLMPFGVINPNRVADFILSTINHAPQTADGNEMVLLDLYGFADDKIRKENLLNIIDEIENLYKIEIDKEVLYKIHQNLLRIYGNMVYFVTAFPEDKNIKHWNDVVLGIKKQLELLQEMVNKEIDKEKRFTIKK